MLGMLQVAPHVHNWSIWPLFLIGQFLHIMLVANAAVHSKINAIKNYETYFASRWVPVVCRVFLSSLSFLLVWNNPSLIDIDKYMTTPGSMLAVTGMIGWFSDSFLDKVLVLLSNVIPGLQKELPIVPPPQN